MNLPEGVVNVVDELRMIVIQYFNNSVTETAYKKKDFAAKAGLGKGQIVSEMFF